ncbi:MULTISPECIES: ABC transporter ATP-binding protein [Rhodopirellula]|uniref:ABC transporter ATP-binding protein n=1 Tax=Rhodopirellula sp. MGV TaxID=2023130 RepID=UPI000B962BBE|nr:multidrug ABC transporter ATP-binding protein [Rhodopirellula sp. MGV]PNY37567.1 ABC transporter ATP-binding protein [Rhodopirellula baltica]
MNDLDGHMDLEPVVTCRELSKRYGEFQALEECDLTVRQGDVFGLLGPNGAGKTTLIRSLLGYLQRSGGDVRVCGVDPKLDSVEVRKRVSYLPGDARLPRHLRGEGVLRFFADLHPLGDYQRSRQIADELELDTRRHVGMMSTGMRQKLALAVVLAPKTPLLILDEPTANLDPSVRASVLRYVTDAHRDGRTVMFSSHVLSEIEETCNRVAFLRKGRLARELVMAELFQRHRIWADLPTGRTIESTRQSIPESFSSQVQINAIDHGTDERPNAIRIETSGDLAPMLGWLATLHLERMRIEPLGLRAIYDSVHHQQADDPRVAPDLDANETNHELTGEVSQ